MNASDFFKDDGTTSIEFVAQWSKKTYTVKFTSSGQYEWNATAQGVAWNTPYDKLPTDDFKYEGKSFDYSTYDNDLTKSQYFTGWKLTVSSGDLDKTDFAPTDSYTIEDLPDGATLTFTAQWAKKYTINADSSNNGVTVNISDKQLDAKGTLYAKPNQSIKITITFRYSNDSRTYKITMNDNVLWQGTKKDFTSTTLAVTGDINIEASSSCLVEGTLITLADGTKKKVEDLTADDKILVFNHETGKLDVSTLLVNAHSDQNVAVETNVLNLHFSNGSIVRVVWEHGFFEVNSRQYVYIDEFNVSDYVGCKFYSTDYVNGEFVNEIVTLESYFTTKEEVRIFSPATIWRFNLFAENILTIAADLDPNIFELDETFKYDEEKMAADIEKYGLYTYDDWKDYMPYEVYQAIPFKYFKVAIGKGYTTYEEIMWLYDNYVKPFIGEANANNSVNNANESDQTNSSNSSGSSLESTTVPSSSKKSSAEDNDTVG